MSVTRRNKCEDCGLEDRNRDNVNLRADNIERCNACAAKIDWPKCIMCNKPRQDYTDGYNHIAFIKLGHCFDCYHWTNVFSTDEGEVFEPVITETFEHYQFETHDPMPQGKSSSCLGHGGRLFTIQFYDGREVRTNNLWYQGVIPEYWREDHPPNARFAYTTGEKAAKKLMESHG